MKAVCMGTVDLLHKHLLEARVRDGTARPDLAAMAMQLKLIKEVRALTAQQVSAARALSDGVVNNAAAAAIGPGDTAATAGGGYVPSSANDVFRALRQTF